MGDDSRATSASRKRDGLVIAGWSLHEARHRLERPGESVKLEPKTTQLLAYLARHAGEPLGREELLKEVWPGVIVSDEALTNAVNKIRRAFGDDRQNPEVIETIPKMGYRLIAPVQPLAPVPVRSVPNSRRGGAGGWPRPRWLVPATVLTLVLVAGMVVLSVPGLWLTGPELVGSERAVQQANGVAGPGLDASVRPSIAVLPFQNLSADQSQEYFADGMTDDLITDLSKLSGLFVIARNSIFAYKGTPAKAWDSIARDLGVHYVLEGSVRKVGDRVRITAQLIDATSGVHIWAERFDRDLKDIFALQDEVRSKIIASLKIELTPSESESLVRRYTASVEAYDYFLRGWEYLWRRSKETNLIARGFFEKSIERDPTFGRAYSYAARTHAREFVDGWTSSPGRSLEYARQLALKAIVLDPALPQAYFNLSMVHLYRKAHEEAIIQAEEAISLDPNYADAYIQLASILTYAGVPSDALPLVEKGMRLNPRFPLGYLRVLGRAYFTLGRFEEATEVFARALERNPSAQRTHMWLAASYALSGQSEAAGWAVDEVLALDSDFSLETVLEAMPYKDPVHLEQLREGLYKAGFSE